MKFLTLIGISALLVSCTVERAANSQDQLRKLLMKYNEDQIMDNLIRGYERMPILQFDYGTVGAKMTSSMGGKSSRGQSGKFTKATAKTLELTKPATLDISPTLTDEITLNVSPLLSNNAVYDAYLAFLKADILRKAKALPTNDVHIWRYANGEYYWVPEKKAGDFFNLCLAVSAKRGATSSNPTALPKPPGTKGLFLEEDLGPLDTSRPSSKGKYDTNIKELITPSQSPTPTSDSVQTQKILDELQLNRLQNGN